MRFPLFFRARAFTIDSNAKLMATLMIISCEMKDFIRSMQHNHCALMKKYETIQQEIPTRIHRVVEINCQMVAEIIWKYVKKGSVA